MVQRYTIRRHDTLARIAKAFYRDGSLYRKLAEYNGILHPERIRTNQRLLIPSLRELQSDAQPVDPMIPRVPHGLAEILALYGNIFEYFNDDGTLDARWEFAQLGFFQLPFSIPLSWNPAVSVTSIQCHHKLVPVLSGIFRTIHEQGMACHVSSFGSCFNFRNRHLSPKLSTHCWGIAVDLNPETNANGTAGDMHPDLVALFEASGFVWGGRWRGAEKEPMHFQYARGY